VPSPFLQISFSIGLVVLPLGSMAQEVKWLSWAEAANFVENKRKSKRKIFYRCNTTDGVVV